MDDLDTKAKILDAAEELFATQGFAATSIRTVIRRAGVNTAAVHYHFRSREGLIAAVLTRRAAPMNEERLRLLDALGAAYPSGALPLEKVVEAFVAPTLRLHFNPKAGGSMFPRLMSRAIIEADVGIHALVAKVFGDVFERFATELSLALPHFSPAEVAWRIHFMVAVLAFTIAIPALHSRPDPQGDVLAPSRSVYPRLRGASSGQESVEAVTNRLVSFLTAGMRAPSLSGAGGGGAPDRGLKRPPSAAPTRATPKTATSPEETDEEQT